MISQFKIDLEVVHLIDERLQGQMSLTLHTPVTVDVSAASGGSPSADVDGFCAACPMSFRGFVHYYPVVFKRHQPPPGCNGKPVETPPGQPQGPQSSPTRTVQWRLS